MKLLIPILLFFQAAIAQGGFTLEKTWPVKVHDFEVDNLGNIYLFGDNMQLKKLNANFDSVGRFNDVRSYGKLHSMDVSNPLRVILWYKDFSTLVILDRFLNLRTAIDLRRIGILQCNAIAQSYDNNIWLYDDLEARVKKINEDGMVLLESADFRVLLDDPPHPHKLEDFNKQLYAYDSTRGLMLIDYFGAYQKILPYKGWRNLHGIGKGLVATDSANFIYLKSDGITITTAPLLPPMQKAKKIRIQGTHVLVHDSEGFLHMYKNNFPAQL